MTCDEPGCTEERVGNHYCREHVLRVKRRRRVLSGRAREAWQNHPQPDGSHVCAICGKPERVAGRRLARDHDHETGVVRGYLCQRCNMAVGLLGDDPVLAGSMQEYLSRTYN